jgi:hypothetical protein
MAEGKGITCPDQLVEKLNDIYPGWEQEYKFYPGRNCRFDYANRQQLIAIEIEGGMWLSANGGKSRHFTGSGAQGDMKKYNAAERRGWTILRYGDNNKKLTQKTVNLVLRDVKAIVTGIDIDGQKTLDSMWQEKLK